MLSSLCLYSFLRSFVWLLVLYIWYTHLVTSIIMIQHTPGLVYHHLHPLTHRIPDPDATKPDDWDEDAPRVIPNEDAVKPEGWLDDEPAEIPDSGMLYKSVVV